jgi:hypothetical protein
MPNDNSEKKKERNVCTAELYTFSCCDRVAQLNNCRISDVGVASAGSRGSTSRLKERIS